MTLRTYNPFDLQIDRLFDEAFRTTGRKASPYCNAWEEGDTFHLELALPGWESKDVKITVEDGVLTVEGAREEKKEADEKTHYMREMVWGNFSRAFTLPDHVNAEKASAAYKDGMLTIAFPKREEAKPRQITIEAR